MLCCIENCLRKLKFYKLITRNIQPTLNFKKGLMLACEAVSMSQAPTQILFQNYTKFYGISLKVVV